MNIKRPHDTFFKQLMRDPEAVKDFLKAFFPASLSERIDYDTVRVIDTEKTDRKYRKFYLDLSVNCMISGADSEIYIVFEHKSYPDRFTLIQMLNYLSVVWEDNIRNNERLRPIIPVVFYHGRRRFNLPTEFADYFDVDEIIQDFLLNFKVVLFDTNQHTDKEILQACGNFYLAASLLAMKHIFNDIESFKPIFKHIVRLDRDHFLTVLQYVIMSKDFQEDELEQIIKEAGGDTMPSLAQRWIDQGIQQGMEAGMVQDAQEMVLDAIETRFGSYPDALKARIIQMTDRNKLKEIHRLILKIQGLDELENAEIWN